MVSLPCINGKPGIHPPKREGDEGERYLERGGEVRVRDSKRVLDYLTSQTRIRATTMYLGRLISAKSERTLVSAEPKDARKKVCKPGQAMQTRFEYCGI